MSDVHKCDSCTSSFDSKKDLKKHAKAIHSKPSNESKSNDQLFECVKCELLFRNFDMFVKHKKLHESSGDAVIGDVQVDAPRDQANNSNGMELIKCSLCNVECSSAIHYLIHVKTEHQLDFNSNLNNSINFNSLLTNAV